MREQSEGFLWKVVASITASLAVAVVIGWFTVARDTQTRSVETRETIALIRTEQLNVLRRLVIIEAKLEKGVDDRYRSAEARRDFKAIDRQLEVIRDHLRRNDEQIKQFSNHLREHPRSIPNQSAHDFFM